MTTQSCGTRSLLAALLIAPCLAHAALGGAPTTSASAQQALKATTKVAAKNGASTTTSWTINTLQTSGGTDIREYVTSGGVVFAVAWQGPQLPDLRALLGSYFTELTSSSTTRHAGHSPNLVNNPDLVVQSGGKPRAYVGRAWVPSLLPTDATTDQIR